MPSITVEIDPKLMERIEREIDRRAGTDEDSEPMDVAQGIAFLCDYALRRIAVLAKHAGKVRKVKRAMRDGKDLPAVEFKRYVPIFKKAALDASGTPKEIAKWTHAAPENVGSPIVARMPRIRKAKRAPVGKIESVVNPEVVAAV